MFTLSCNAFMSGGNIPSEYTCDGPDTAPTLSVHDIPAGTVSMTLIVDDPDAPKGTWVHWLLWNLPPTATTIDENHLPEGTMQGLTDFGRPGYGGPCPPNGQHHYHFKLYALDTMLDLPPNSKKADIEAAMDGHIIDDAELIGVYRREEI